MKTQSKATQDQVKMMAQQLYDDQLARWEERYHEHSKHIVESVSEWMERTFIPFTSEYSRGQFRVNSVEERVDIPLLEEGKNHFSQEFPKLLSFFEEIKSTATQLATEVREKMTGSGEKSFEHMVADAISKTCPQLEPRIEGDLTENTFRPVHLFESVFDGTNHLLRGKEDSVEIVASGGLWRLNYRDDSRIILVAYGKEAQIFALKETIMKLWHSDSLQQIVKEFNRINAEMKKNADRSYVDLKNELQYITIRVARGISLQSYGACQHCPKKPVPPRADEENQ